MRGLSLACPLALGVLTACATHSERRVTTPPAAARPTSSAPVALEVPPPLDCSAWRTGSYLSDMEDPNYPLKLAPGDTVSSPTPAFAEELYSRVSSSVTLELGADSYVLVFTEDNGDAAHLFVFQKLSDRFCFAGAWERVFGGLGSTASLADSWIAPGGQRALLLLQSVDVTRGYYYEAKPGESCPASAEDPAPEPPSCHIPPGYSSSYYVLALDTAAHRLWTAYSSEEDGVPRRESEGTDEMGAEARLVPSEAGVTLAIDGVTYRWNDQLGAFDAGVQALEPPLSATELAGWLSSHGVQRKKPSGVCSAVGLGVPRVDGLLCREPVRPESQNDVGSERFKLWRWGRGTIDEVWQGRASFSELRLRLDLDADGKRFTLGEERPGLCQSVYGQATEKIEIGDPGEPRVVAKVCRGRGRYSWQAGRFIQDSPPEPLEAWTH